jgi:hypothetical protein
MTASRQIVIVPIAALDQARLAELARGGPFTVWFLGSSFSRFSELRTHLPSGWSMPVPGPLLNGIADRLRDLVIDLDAHIQPRGLTRLAWDASLVGERGPLASTLMLHLARFVTFVEAICQPGRHLVITDDIAFGRLLLSEAQRRAEDVGWLAPAGSFQLWDHIRAAGELVARSLEGLRRRASVVRRFLMRKAELAWLRRRYPLPLQALRRADAIVFVWGRADTFSENGPLVREFNFGRLPDLLKQAGFGVGYLAYPLTYVARFAAIANNALKAKDAVALIEDFIPWWAIIPAALSGLSLPRRVGRLSLLGIDVTAVLRMEARRDRRLAASTEAQLLAHVGRGLARRRIRPKLLFYLYEAQPWEKMLALGMRKDMPTRVIGVQHAPFAWNYISFFPSHRDIEDGRWPDLLLTAGRGYADWFRDAGVPPARLKPLGAVRYENIVSPPLPREPAVLCCTGIEFDEAVELAVKAAAATEDTGIPLIINFHPVTDETWRTRLRDAVTKTVGALADHVTYSVLPMRDLLEQVDVVVYTTSAACFEAVQAGRHAIYVGRDLVLDYDKLPNDIAVRCRSVDELRGLITQPWTAEACRQSPTTLASWLEPVIDAATLRKHLTERTGFAHAVGAGDPFADYACESR